MTSTVVAAIAGAGLAPLAWRRVARAKLDVTLETMLDGWWIRSRGTWR